MAKGLAGGLVQYGDPDFALYLRRAFAQSAGYSRDLLARPVIGIASTPSAFNPCHRALPELEAAVSRGVLAAGGLPMPFPTISLGESFAAPTTMKFRNLMAMDTEEMIRAQPMDAVVLLSGCDKTVPAQIMGALSADKPALLCVTGPMLTGSVDGERVGACTDCRRFWGQYRAGALDRPQIDRVEASLVPTAGTCGVMGTASTMACLAEVMGLSLPGTAAIPAVHSDRLRAGEASGALGVELALRERRPSAWLDGRSVDNALRVLLAIGGSTNALIHLTAIAGRLGLRLTLDRLNRLSAETPVLVDLKPTGAHYMEDFHRAGGLGAVLRELKPLLHLDAGTVTGETLGARLAEKPQGFVDRQVIAALEAPIRAEGGLVAVRGTLAPEGAIVKRAAADPQLLDHEGRAVVFSSLADLAARIDDPDLDVTPQDVLVLQHAGPTSAAAMPEAGYLPIPKKLAARGVTDMLRISDARMSGTAYGAVVLHVAPDATSGGPLALVRTGDHIRLSVREQRLDLLVPDAELARRRAALPPAADSQERGFSALYAREILQAPDGCDFGFLRPPLTQTL